MTVEEKKKEFIEAWGVLGPKWGISKTMAHMHALLLVASEPLCASKIKELLNISIGNVNQNLKCLIQWGLINGVSIEGERKEFFIAEKDMWKAFTNIVKKRKENELVPLLEILGKLQNIPTSDSANHPEESKNFDATISELTVFAKKADGMLDKFISAENSWLLKGYRMMIR
jgi:DNA-binding transcriptional regulator GbsR (MarR family)